MGDRSSCRGSTIFKIRRKVQSREPSSSPRHQGVRVGVDCVEPGPPRRAFSFADCGPKLDGDSVRKHMSREQMIVVAAVVILVLAIFGWSVLRRGGEQATSQPPQQTPSQQQTPPQPQQP